jgi:hypothetical protein
VLRRRTQPREFPGCFRAKRHHLIFVVLGVGADPEPDESAPLTFDREGAMIAADSRGPESADFLK